MSASSTRARLSRSLRGRPSSSTTTGEPSITLPNRFQRCPTESKRIWRPTRVTIDEVGTRGLDLEGGEVVAAQRDPRLSAADRPGRHVDHELGRRSEAREALERDAQRAVGVGDRGAAEGPGGEQPAEPHDDDREHHGPADPLEGPLAPLEVEVLLDLRPRGGATGGGRPHGGSCFDPPGDRPSGPPPARGGRKPFADPLRTDVARAPTR